MARRRQGAPIEAARRSAEALKEEVLGRDRAVRRRYIREFHEEFSDWSAVATRRDLVMDCLRSGIVYMGDYHALPASQRFAASLLAELAASGRPMILAVEVIRHRHQELLDRWLSGRIPEQQFLRQIRYERDWGYPWEGFRHLMATAQEHGVPVAAIDCAPRRDLRLIRRRDRTIAARLTSLLQEDPERRLFVHMGESHLASTHLPLMVRENLHAVAMEVRDVIVVQNADEIYWDLLNRGVDDFEVVQVDPRRWCVFTASPLEKYEAYRQIQEGWISSDPYAERDYQPVLHGLVDSLLGFLGVDKYSWCLSQEGLCLEFLVDAYPEVYGPHRLPEIARILADLPLEKIRLVQAELNRRGCCWVRKANAVFLSRFQLDDCAEQAAHFVHFALSGRLRGEAAASSAPSRGIRQVFYRRVLAETRAALGVKVADPARNLLRDAVLVADPEDGPQPRDPEGRSASARTFLAELQAFLAAPPGRDADVVPASLARRFPRSESGIAFRARQMGRALGQGLWVAYRESRITRRHLRDLFTDPLSSPGAALRRLRDLHNLG